MGLLDKVRDFFYDDEEDIEEIPKKKKKVIPNEYKEIKKDKWEDKHKKEKQEISERELFKAERTFNFPMDIIDEDFSEVEVKEEVKVEKEVEEKPVKKETPIIEPRNISIRNYTKYEKKEEVEEPVKKFKPTPVISPIYGILDKNYKKEDLLIDSTIEEKEPKKLDYEDVRKRAYSNVYKEENEEKDIFYNMNEEEKEEDEDVKIIYNDVTFEDEEEKEDDKNKTIGEKIEEYERSLEEKDDDFDDDEDTDDDILSETKEQDLFNLIDNMYNSDEEEDEEEE